MHILFSISLQYIHSADIIHRVSAMFDFFSWQCDFLFDPEKEVCQGLWHLVLGRVEPVPYANTEGKSKTGPFTFTWFWWCNAFYWNANKEVNDFFFHLLEKEYFFRTRLQMSIQNCYHLLKCYLINFYGFQDLKPSNLAVNEDCELKVSELLLSFKISSTVHKMWIIL